MSNRYDKIGNPAQVGPNPVEFSGGQTPEMLLETLRQDKQSGFELGLIQPHQSLLQLTAEMRGRGESGLIAMHEFMLQKVYLQERPASWSERGVVMQDIVKIKSMHDLTARGEVFEEQLRKLAALENSQLHTKTISEWRIINAALRGFVDETPQILFNVLLPHIAPTNNPMHMRFVGSLRPTLAHELLVEGDNAYDDYNHALERVATEYGSDRLSLHWHLGRTIEPGVISIATARGTRGLDDADAYADWIKGAMEYENIQKMPPRRRRIAEAIIAARNVGALIGQKANVKKTPSPKSAKCS